MFLESANLTILRKKFDEVAKYGKWTDIPQIEVTIAPQEM
jgi:hypothetical protein